MKTAALPKDLAVRSIGVRLTDDQYEEVLKDYHRRKAKDADVPRVYTLSSHIRFLIDIGLAARSASRKQ